MLHVDSQGQRRLCCEATPSPKEYSQVSYESFYHSPYMNQKRAEFLQGKFPKECQTCEKATHKTQTFQHQLNEMFQTKILDILKNTNNAGKVEIDPFQAESFGGKYVDYRRLACNYSCVTCGPDYSSKWRKDLKEWQGIHPYRIDELPPMAEFEQEEAKIVTLPNLDILYFAGGEPLVRPKHLEFLKAIPSERRRRIRLIYNTNLSLSESQMEPFLEIWKSFQEVWIFCSVDGLGKLGELVRKGFQSEKFLHSFLRLEQKFRGTQIHFAIDFTVTSYFFFQLKEFSRFLLQHQGHYQGKFMLGRKGEAGFLRVEYLPLATRNQLVEEWDLYYHSLSEKERKRLDEFRRLVMTQAQFGEFSDQEKIDCEKTIEFHSKISGKQYFSFGDLMRSKQRFSFSSETLMQA